MEPRETPKRSHRIYKGSRRGEKTKDQQPWPILHDTATWNGHGTRTHDEFLKIHMTRVSDTFRTRHGSMIEVYVPHNPGHSSHSTNPNEQQEI